MTQQQQQQKDEIIKSRVGGFGGSDTKMFYKVGVKGIESLSNTDKKRIAVAMGQIPYEETFTSQAMEAGNEFEAWLAENVYKESYSWKNNKRLDAPSETRNFTLFAHADFCNSYDEVVEAKYTSSTLEQTEIDYMAQLQWYYFLGVRRVVLTKGTQGVPFNEYEDRDIKKNKSYQTAFKKGIQLIDTFCDTFVYEVPEVWTTGDLLPHEQKGVQLLTSYVNEIARLETSAKELKDKLYQLMLDNGVKSLKNDNLTLSIIAPTKKNIFDKARLLKDHPEIKESDYIKQSDVKGYLKINVK